MEKTHLKVFEWVLNQNRLIKYFWKDYKDFEAGSSVY